MKLLILLTVTVAFLNGCSQKVNVVKIKRRTPLAPTSFTYISTVDLQGATSVVPTSPTRRMSIHTLGGNNQRTNSTSASYRMTSGIGVD
jgi:hypothetical protein